MTDPRMPIGDTLVGVHYELLSWESEPPPTESADEVSMGLTLEWLHASPTRVSWSSITEREGLVFGGPESYDPSPEVEIVDVSSRWGSLVGDRLEDCRFSHAQPPASLPWAMNLHFESGRHLVIALGELLPSGPAYIPDCLVITDSRDFAQGFAPVAALGTAWSDPAE